MQAEDGKRKGISGRGRGQLRVREDELYYRPYQFLLYIINI